MSGARTTNAIGAITCILRDALETARNQTPALNNCGNVILGLPSAQPAQGIYLSLYEINFDASLRNVSLGDGESPPIWLVLKYAVVVYDDGDLQHYNAHRFIGRAISHLQSLHFETYSGLTQTWVHPALDRNPEQIHLTFDEAPSELISRLLGSAAERYQSCFCFQIRPVLIQTREIPDFQLLIGIDYTAGGEIITSTRRLECSSPVDESIFRGSERGVDIAVRPIKFVHVETISSTRLEFDVADKEIEIVGSGLDENNLYIIVGGAEIQIIGNTNPVSYRWQMSYDNMRDEISAGTHSLQVAIIETITDENNNPIRRWRRVSNSVHLHIPPYVERISDVQNNRLTIEGRYLGRPEDAVVVAFYRDNRVVAIYDSFQSGDFHVDQTSLIVDLTRIPPIQNDTYRILLRVNNQQARNSPEKVI